MHFQFPYQLKRLYKKQMTTLLISHGIRSFASSLIGIFIPLYLLSLGYSLGAVALYLLINISLYAPIYYFMYRIAARIGIKKIMMLSMPFQVLYFLGLQQFQNFTAVNELVSLAILAVIMTISETMYYTGFHTDIAKSTNSNTDTKSIGQLNAVSALLSAIAPLVGALLITYAGFHLTFSVVVIFFIISSLPLLFTKEVHEKFPFKWKDLIKKNNEGLFTPFFSEGINIFAMQFLWPLFFYAVFSTYGDVGLLYTVASVTAIITAFVASKVMNKKNKKKILRFGNIIKTIILLVKLGVKSMGVMLPLHIGGSVATSTTSISYHAYVYELSRKKGIMSTLFIREFFLNIGRTIMILLLLLFLGYFSEEKTIIIMLIVTSIGAMGMNSITRKKLMKK